MGSALVISKIVDMRVANGHGEIKGRDLNRDDGHDQPDAWIARRNASAAS
jgi:hypothetical protein